MKKLLIISGMVMATVCAMAQSTFRAQSFFAQGVQSLYVTNTAAITNLNTASANTTNAPGTAWSNYVSGGTARYVAATNSAASGAWTNVTKNLLKDVDLWALRDGSPAVMQSTTNGTDRPTLSYATVTIRINAGSGASADQANTLVFTPLYGIAMDSASAGLNPKPTPVEGTTADQWTVGITPAGAATVVLCTNVPLYKWPGARGLRLRRVVGGDTDASSQVIYDEISLNGYVP